MCRLRGESFIIGSDSDLAGLNADDYLSVSALLLPADYALVDWPAIEVCGDLGQGVVLKLPRLQRVDGSDCLDDGFQVIEVQANRRDPNIGVFLDALDERATLLLY
jgi:hypothetical protein